MNKLSK